MSAGAALAAVVVPVYNAAAYLPACIAAIAAQTMPDFRCYLVDDGSTDGSGALCEQAAGENIHNICVDKNPFHSSASLFSVFGQSALFTLTLRRFSGFEKHKTGSCVNHFVDIK